MIRPGTRLLLILRPEPGASATLARARAAGFDAVATPLFEIAPVAATLSCPPGDAVLFTSANAVRALGAQAASLAGRRVYAVGAATAAAARAAGFDEICTGDGDAAAIVARAAADGVRRLLHPTGRDHHAVARPDVAIDTRIVYAARPLSGAGEAVAAALRPDAIVLLHSPRAAAAFAGWCDDLGQDRGVLRLAAISAAAADSAGAGWAAVAVAAAPTDAALIDAASRLSATPLQG